MRKGEPEESDQDDEGSHEEYKDGEQPKKPDQGARRCKHWWNGKNIHFLIEMPICKRLKPIIPNYRLQIWNSKLDKGLWNGRVINLENDPIIHSPWISQSSLRKAAIGTLCLDLSSRCGRQREYFSITYLTLILGVVWNLTWKILSRLGGKGESNLLSLASASLFWVETLNLDV